MRTTINLDDDTYQLASIYASARGITLGAALGELVRRGDQTRALTVPSSRLKTARNGLKMMPSRGRVITSEMVKAAQEDEDG